MKVNGLNPSVIHNNIDAKDHGIHNSRQVTEIKGKKVIAGNHNSNHKATKSLANFSISPTETKKNVSKFFNNDKISKKHIKNATKQYKEYGYSDQEATKMANALKTLIVSEEIFNQLVSDTPTKQQQLQGYVSQRQYAREFDQAITHFNELGYTNNVHEIVAESQAQSSREQFLDYIKNTPSLSELTQGYNSKTEVNNEFSWATAMLIAAGYSPEDSSRMAAEVQTKSAHRTDFVKEIKYHQDFRIWAETILTAKGYDSADVGAIFNDLNGRIKGYDNLASVITMLPTREQAAKGDDFATKTSKKQRQLIADAFKTLNVAENASIKEIKTAYKKLALKYHPDKNPSVTATEIFTQIQKAYDLLINHSDR